MFLAHLLHQQGHDAIVLEQRDRDYVEGRVRAGVLEQGTVDLMHRLGIGQNVAARGLVHEGVNIAVNGDPFRIDLAELTNGSAVTVYGQQAVMKDLFDAAVAQALDIVFEAQNVQLQSLDKDMVEVSWQDTHGANAVSCQFVVGCDGSYGICSSYLPKPKQFEQTYPFGWLGILAEVPPAHEELIYGWHPRGFTLASMRSATRSRYYIQCPADTLLADWSEAQIWDEICTRLGPDLSRGVTRGQAFETSIAPLRSRVTEPMSANRLFLAGDAAHIVPPTGAKGLNLAVTDVMLLADAFDAYFTHDSETALTAYSQRALARTWQAQRFSWWFTHLTHCFADASAYTHRLQQAELNSLRTSRAQQQVFAQNYVGLPL